MRQTIITIALGILSIVAISTVLSSTEWGEREDEERHEYDADHYDDTAFGGAWIESRPDVRAVDNATYQRECGSCHFAYQPGLLPGQDWERIMDALAEHYGDDASLDEGQAADIRGYLRDNAADRASLSRARAFAAGSEASEGLPRVTTTGYFRREHAEIPTRFVRGNAAVASFSNCPACHRNAAAGVYNEHQVVIPGVGKWDD